MTLLSLCLYGLLVIFLVGATVALSYPLGPRHSDRATGTPFESGIVSEGSARVRLSARFYLVAMLFVVFDLEAAFIFAWAVAGRELGWPGYAEVPAFIAVLLVTLVYLVRVGALDWAPRRRRAAGRGEQRP